MWYLVDAMLPADRLADLAVLRVFFQSESDLCREILLPVQPNGRLHELVFLPRLKSAFLVYSTPVNKEQKVQQTTIRKVGVLERIWRMANRVLGSFRYLEKHQRIPIGITLRSTLFDLAGCYQIISKMRRRFDYREWLESSGKIDDKDITAVRKHLTSLYCLPRMFVVLEEGGEGSDLFKRTMSSIENQIFKNFIVKDDRNIFGAIDRNTWVIFLRTGDSLSPLAFYWFACEILKKRNSVAFYSDDDVMDAAGVRSEPRCKPDWSLTHYLATDYVGSAIVLRADEVMKAGGVDEFSIRYGPYDLLLRILDNRNSDGSGIVEHVPAILLHRSTEDESDDALDEWQCGAVTQHFLRIGARAGVLRIASGIRRIHHVLPENLPLVSIIIPTRNELGLFKRCVESILEKTAYPSFEILVVDNRSTDPEALSYIASLDGRPCPGAGIRVLRYDCPFNFSAINNYAVQRARGDFVCLLNNDTEVISRDWLDEMMGHALQERVGAVGAKLLFPDERVQHGGDVVGPGGCASHLHFMIGGDAPGYCRRAVVAQELSAVTAACLLTRRSVFNEVGGLDSHFLRVAFNDVDYCLKLRKSGYKVVWTPHAKLYHHESVSRGKDSGWIKSMRAESEVLVMRVRWKKEMQNDPFYNPNLSYVRPDFSMSHVQRLRLPWANELD